MKKFYFGNYYVSATFVMKKKAIDKGKHIFTMYSSIDMI